MTLKVSAFEKRKVGKANKHRINHDHSILRKQIDQPFPNPPIRIFKEASKQEQLELFSPKEK